MLDALQVFEGALGRRASIGGAQRARMTRCRISAMTQIDTWVWMRWGGW